MNQGTQSEIIQVWPDEPQRRNKMIKDRSEINTSRGELL